jgi:hypothetical protein
MNLYEEIRKVLVGDNGIKAVVDTRVWNEWPRTYTLPCIFMQIDNVKESDQLDGQVGMVIADGTITCRGQTEDDSHDLWLLVRAKLAGYEGTFSAVVESTAFISTPTVDNSTDHWYDKVMACHWLYTP